VAMCTDNGDGTSLKGQCASSSSSSSDDVCFSGDDSVTLESGATILFSELAIGDKIQTADAEGALSFSNVIALPHAVNNKLASFVNVVTASGKSLNPQGHQDALAPAVRRLPCLCWQPFRGRLPPHRGWR
jgi:hypothetical protein